MSKTPEERQAAIEDCLQLLDAGAPRPVLLATLQRSHGYSRAQAYRLAAEATELRGSQGIIPRAAGSDLVRMAQAMLGTSLAAATLEGNHKAVAQLSKVLLEALKASGSITSTMAPDPDPAIDTLMAVKAAHTREN